MTFLGGFFLLRHAFIKEGVARGNAFYYFAQSAGDKKCELVAASNMSAGEVAFAPSQII